MWLSTRARGGLTPSCPPSTRVSGRLRRSPETHASALLPLYDGEEGVLRKRDLPHGLHSLFALFLFRE